jgi:hypothetical protein
MVVQILEPSTVAEAGSQGHQLHANIPQTDGNGDSKNQGYIDLMAYRCLAAKGS